MVSDYGAKRLPPVVMGALDGGESRLGRILLWLTGGLFVFMTVMFFVTPEPMEAKLPTVPYFLGGFAVMFGLGVFVSRKSRRVGHSTFARILREAPHRVTGIREEAVQPSPGGQRVQRVDVVFDGEQEFAPRPRRSVRVLGFEFVTRSWVLVRVEGMLLRRKLVLPFHEAPELLSYLFALVAEHNPGCTWGARPVGELARP